MPFSTAAELHELDPKLVSFYGSALRRLQTAGVPFMVGGAYALHRFTGVARRTKDLDVFVKPVDLDRALAVLQTNGCRTEVTASHWLGKAICGELFVDVIFNSGNGVAAVDDEWLENAVDGMVLGVDVKLTPPEETLWSKAFVMERERYDGADVAHILHACAETMDWERVLRRFDGNWRVLYAHVVLFGYVYPSERTRIPAWVSDELCARVLHETAEAAHEPPVCKGTLLSRQQYLVDVESWGYQDARVVGGEMTEAEAVDWSHRGEDEESEREAAAGGGR